MNECLGRRVAWEGCGGCWKWEKGGVGELEVKWIGKMAREGGFGALQVCVYTCMCVCVHN